MAADAPNSYSDPYWTQLASATEQKLGLPAGLLGAIVTHGERSNADQVSEAGAKTPFQITPATRDAVLKRDGIDAYLSPENAAEVAGLVLKDGVNFAKQRTDDPEAQTRLAAGFYHGGGDTANWGPRTHAYVARVSEAADSARLQGLHDSFDEFMKANPAAPTAPSATAGAPTDDSSGLHAAFDALMKSDPVTPASSGSAAPAAPSGGPSIGDQVVGAGEAGLSAVTSIPSYLSFLTGGALQAGKEALYGISAHGTPQYQQDLPGTFDRISDAATKAGSAFQYQPRTDTGQDYARSLAEGLTPLAGMNPLEGGLLASGAPALADAGRAAPGAAVDGATAAANAIRARIGQVTGEAPAATPGTLGSAGAAATDIALQRQATAAALPVPIGLTHGQATRDFAAQQFEGETAKNPNVGEPIREKFALQNKQVGQNFDAMIDRTGAQQASDLEAGRFIVDKTLTDAAAREKKTYDDAYSKADQSGETLAPVNIQPTLDYLNSQPDGLPSNAIPDVAKAYAVKLGIATREADGNLVARDGVNLREAESWRKEINGAIGFEPTDQRQGGIIKSSLDGQTEGAGGDLYRAARKARERYAQLFEDNKVVSDLMATKPGTADRKVALEDVVDRVVRQGSREDLSNFRRTLDVSDQHGGFAPGTDGPGRQAWRELQGATLRYVADQAGATGKNAARDTHGSPIVSYAGLNKAIRELDTDGKLDFILGKKDAQTVRDIGEIASVIKTVPPGAVNTSNTAATLLAALGESAVTASFTGIPAPLVTIAKFLKDHRDTKLLRAKVETALAGLPKPTPLLAPSPRTF